MSNKFHNYLGNLKSSALWQSLLHLWEQLFNTNISSFAAHLSYLSMLAFAPILAVSTWVSSIMYGHNPELGTTLLTNLIKFIAPNINPSPGNASVDLDPKLVEIVNNIIASTGTQIPGVTGIVFLVSVIFWLLLKIEESFNQIWQVSLQRALLKRLLVHWCVLSIGGILAVSLLSIGYAGLILPLIGKLKKSFLDTSYLPISRLEPLLIGFSSSALLILVLACLFKYVPHTRVRWRYALAGAAVSVALLWLNNIFSFIYINRVIMEVSFYGSLSIIPLLMIALYTFWFIILSGSLLSCYWQNKQMGKQPVSWAQLGDNERYTLCLKIYLQICAAYLKQGAALRLKDLAFQTCLSLQLVEAALDLLVRIGLITSIPGSNIQSMRLQPAQPLHKLSLKQLTEMLHSSLQTNQLQLDTQKDSLLARLQAGQAEALRSNMSVAAWLERQVK